MSMKTLANPLQEIPLFQESSLKVMASNKDAVDKQEKDVKEQKHCSVSSNGRGSVDGVVLVMRADKGGDPIEAPNTRRSQKSETESSTVDVDHAPPSY